MKRQVILEFTGGGNYSVWAADKSVMLGRVNVRRDGWRFTPFFQRGASRKGWPTITAALKSFNLAPVGDPTIDSPAI